VLNLWFHSPPAAPGTVALYLATSADALRPGILTRRQAANREATPGRRSRFAVLDAPRGDIRSHEGHPSHEGNRASAQVATMRTDLVGLRDRALLLIGFSGAFRRSELVALDVADVEVGEDGITVTLRRSKTEQEDAGRKVGIPGSRRAETCPARALRAWREA
jgi:integrase